MRWPLTFITDRFLEPWMGAATRGPVILIRPKYEHDEGIYRHELTHVKQWFYSAFTFGLWYKFSRTARARYEAEAYAEQTKHSDAGGGLMPASLGAARMWENYDLGLTEAECAALIAEYL